MIWMVQSNFIPTFCSFSTSSNHWTHRSLRDAFVWHVFFMSKSTNMKKNHRTVDSSAFGTAILAWLWARFWRIIWTRHWWIKTKNIHNVCVYMYLEMDYCILFLHIYAFLQWKANLWKSSSHLNLCHAIMKQCVWTWNIYANLADEIHMHSASVAQKVSVWSHFDVNPTIHKLFRVMVNPFQALKCSN
jgi:hypothetical protein